MFPERSRTPATKSNPKREGGASGEDVCLSSSKPSNSMFQETDATSTASDDGPIVSVSSGLLNCLRIPVPVAPQWRGLNPQTDSPINRAPNANTKQAKGERTHFVWVPAGGGPTITRTSPTPPPPTRRVPRHRPNLTRTCDALTPPASRLSPRTRRPTNRGVESEQDAGVDSDSEDNNRDGGSWISSESVTKRHEVSSDCAVHSASPIIAGDRAPNEFVLECPPAAGPSISTAHKPLHRRTLADYDRTNARIRALNAELLSDPRSQRRGHPYRTPARRTQRSNVRYLNVPSAAVDALVALRVLRGSEARRRASSAGTGIVDISESESSEFESADEEEEEGSGLACTPGRITSETPKAETPGEACSETLVCSEIPQSERPERLRAVGMAAASAEPKDCVSVAGSPKAITHPAPPTDADTHRSQWQLFRSGPFVHDRTRAAEEDRLGSGHHHVGLQTSTPTSTSSPSSTRLPTAPHRHGKKRKRARDQDMDGDRVRVEASEGLAREGKRRKATPGASVSAT